jgi:Cft2 family RNA processing exonuclease
MLEDPIKYANIPKKGVNVIIMKRKFGTSQRKCREEKYRKSVSFIDDPPHPSSKAR